MLSHSGALVTTHDIVLILPARVWIGGFSLDKYLPLGKLYVRIPF